MDDHPSLSKCICDGDSSPSKRMCDVHSSSSKCISITCSNNKNVGGNQTIINELINTKIVHNHSPVPSQTTHSSSQVSFEPIDYVGGKVSSNIDVVLRRLGDKEFHPIGVWGMGGVGKTMLLTSVFNKLQENTDIAGSAYWVSVSENCSLYLLQQKIARAICLNFDGEEAVHSRAALLHHKLIEMRRVVLILDDVWDCFLADEIGIPRGKSHCKMIFSTRLIDLCRRIGYDDYIVNVRPLGKDEAFKLFCKALGNYDKLSAEVQELAPFVAKECHCVPLAIKVIAASLIGKYEIYAWQFAVHNLENLNMRHEEMEDKVHGVLRYSYDHLKGDDLKKCFLNCALYPEDHEICTDELIELLITEGSLEYVKGRKMQLCRGHTVLIELVNSCLLEQSIIYPKDKVKMHDHPKYKVKMHDLIREMAIKISSKEDPRFLIKSGLQMNIISETDWNEDLVKASLSYNKIKEIPCGMSPYTPILTVLLLNHNWMVEIPDSFFVHMKSLEVLNLSDTYIERLPDSVSDLEDLRMLLLNRCNYLKYVPSLAKLSKLRVLELPDLQDEGFRVLELPVLEEVPKGMEGLKSLEKLNYCQWKMSDIIKLNSFIESAQSLTHYTLVLQPNWNDCFDNPEYLDDDYVRRFYIKGAKLGDDNPILKIPPATEMVFVTEMEIKRVNNLVDALPSFADVTQLKCLEVGYCQGLRYIAIQLEGSYETLEKLTLYGLNYLKRIIKHGAYCFSHLKQLKFERCPNIEVGLPIKSAHHKIPLLPNLEVIWVTDCSKLKEIFETNDMSKFTPGIDDYNFDLILSLPKLQDVLLGFLPELSSIYRGLLLCTALQYMIVTNCPKLILLPLSKSLICSRSLESRSSIPKQEDNPDWWESLLNEYPEDAYKLSRFKAFCSLDDDEGSKTGSLELRLSDFNSPCDDDNSELSNSVTPSLASFEGSPDGDESRIISEAMLPLFPVHPTKRGKHSTGQIFQKLQKILTLFRQ